MPLDDHQPEPRELSARLMSLTLLVLAFSLTISYISMNLHAFFPWDPQAPGWRVNVARSLISTFPLALNYYVTVQLASFVDPVNRRLQAFSFRIRRVALFIGMGYVMLVPVLIANAEYAYGIFAFLIALTLYALAPNGNHLNGSKLSYLIDRFRYFRRMRREQKARKSWKN